MCGVTGFFVGCDMTGHCPHGEGGCTLIRGHKALEKWHEKASVRRAPRRMLNEEDIASHIFPQALAPVVHHPIVQKLDGEQITNILNNHMFRYLDFTAKLEVVVVNDVMKDLAFGHTPFPFDERMQVDALKIYTDEGYHALFSMDLFHQAKSLLEVDPIVPEKPAFIRSLNRLLGACESERERRLTKLFFVATSETLITSSLTEISKAGEVPDAVKNTITDHAMDEARHHAFFSDLIEKTWTQMTSEDRDLVIRKFPDFIHAFVQPDTEAIQAELTANGLSLSDAEVVIADIYTKDVIADYAKLCGNTLLGIVRETPEFQNQSINEVYHKAGLAA